jgi:tetratricopeptide (TPR) repeat protein
MARFTLALDPLDHGARFEVAFSLRQLRRKDASQVEFARIRRILRDAAEAYREVAFGYQEAGLRSEAIEVLETYRKEAAPARISPMALYQLALLHSEEGDSQEAASLCAAAEAACMDYCFPSQTRDIAVLRHAQFCHPDGARAWYYLGNLFYDKRRHAEAEACWKEARSRDGGIPAVHRNLALAAYDIRKDAVSARPSLERAFALDSGNARLLYELLQLGKNAGDESVERRLGRCEAHPQLVAERDDLYVERLVLLLQAGRFDEAARRITDRVYDVYEGGESRLVRVFEWTSILRALSILAAPAAWGAHALSALSVVTAAFTLPECFHEGRPNAVPRNHLHYFAAVAAGIEGEESAQREHFARSCLPTTWVGEASFYRALSLRRSGETAAAEQALAELEARAAELLDHPGRPEFFATATPTPPPFEGDRAAIDAAEGHFLRGLAMFGRGDCAGMHAELADALAARPNHLGAWIHAGRSADIERWL